MGAALRLFTDEGIHRDSFKMDGSKMPNEKWDPRKGHEALEVPEIQSKVDDYFKRKLTFTQRIKNGWKDASYHFESFPDGSIQVTNDYGEILTREEFKSLIAGLNQFYAEISDKDIEKWNRSAIEWEFALAKDTTYDLGVRNHFQEKKNPGFIYIIKSPYGYKIGRTRKLRDRLNFFGVKLPFKIELILAVEVRDMASAEYYLHDIFEKKRLNGEWFDLTPEDIEDVKEMSDEGLL